MNRNLRQEIKRLDRRTLKQVRELVDQLIQEAETPPEVPDNPDREVVESRKTGSMTYRREKVKCGKKGCKCERGELHGPYWYRYYREGGKLKSVYIGKELKK